jgi:predicted transcriptional regulator of viral defense system
MVEALTKPQRKIIEWIEQNKKWIINTTDVASILSSTQKEAYNICLSLSRKKWFSSLGNEHFLLLVSPQNKKLPRLHPLLIGSYLIEPYYYSYRTALAYHGFAPRIKSPIYIVTTNNRSHLEIKDISYRIVCIYPRKFFGFKPIKINSKDVFIADKEKTMIDSVEKFWYAGGIVDVIRILKENINNLDVSLMVDYAVQMQSSMLIQRLGYLLDQLDVSFDEQFMLSYSRQTLYYLDPYYSCGIKPHRNEKWNLMINVPDTLFKSNK